MMYNDILNFCFDEVGSEKFFEKDIVFDQVLIERYSGILEQAAAVEFYTWRSSIKGRLAEIIILDQFSRNIYRDTPAAFAQDAMSLALAQEAVAAGALEALETMDERKFLLMPYMHSESKLIHQQAEKLFKQYTNADTVDAELKHKVIIDRFGRYPHRNDILGRVSSSEEIAFLTQPDSSFL
ncbi:MULTISPECIES: DUF924 family protein [unclassified Psychrobacter]|uniref:DUF924 family protein n=1 Tax=unclassified Psychrobacter TaxID=196806 RepID=UPI000EBB3941|nr:MULTISPECIES: DUF924 family protein [unclassified Psychrobacter]MBE8609249.1 DUF924 domain-containing protein [Pseudomonas lundensis]HCI74993.1 DUF924 domain-containing protein [Psychrobacter sp.]